MKNKLKLITIGLLSIVLIGCSSDDKEVNKNINVNLTKTIDNNSTKKELLLVEDKEANLKNEKERLANKIKEEEDLKNFNLQLSKVEEEINLAIKSKLLLKTIIKNCSVNKKDLSYEEKVACDSYTRGDLNINDYSKKDKLEFFVNKKFDTLIKGDQNLKKEYEKFYNFKMSKIKNSLKSNMDNNGNLNKDYYFNLIKDKYKIMFKLENIANFDYDHNIYNIDTEYREFFPSLEDFEKEEDLNYLK